MSKGKMLGWTNEGEHFKKSLAHMMTSHCPSRSTVWKGDDVMTTAHLSWPAVSTGDGCRACSPTEGRGRDQRPRTFDPTFGLLPRCVT